MVINFRGINADYNKIKTQSPIVDRSPALRYNCLR
jgi:hypothetical protein